MNDAEPHTAAEWHAQRRRAEVEATRRQARRKYGQSSLLADIGDEEAEPAAREMLAAASSAFWLAEDTELESQTHKEMDDYGRWVRTTFGCRLAYESGTYYQRCPAAIAHKRVGMSMGFTARRRICSICAEDLADCPHDRHELYEVAGGIGPTGRCRACGSDECTEHIPERTYRVPAIGIVTEIDQVREVSIVARPAQPLARLTSVPVDGDLLRDALGSSFETGMTVSCDRCLNACKGIAEIPSLTR